MDTGHYCARFKQRIGQSEPQNRQLPPAPGKLGKLPPLADSRSLAPLIP